MKITGYNQEVEIRIEEEEVFFENPMTGFWCENLSQITQGWSFQSDIENTNYKKLIEAIEKMYSDDMLIDWCIDIDILDITKTPYCEAV